MNQSRSEYVVEITWREKQISTLLCDRIHDDYIAAISSKKWNKLPQICVQGKATTASSASGLQDELIQNLSRVS
jgi:hypothetical protein